MERSQPPIEERPPLPTTGTGFAARDLDYLKGWIAARSPAGSLGEDSGELRRELEQFFTHIFNRSKDGISIHATDFTIVGVNTTIRSWYDQSRPLVGRKCFEAYHGRQDPCPNCPSEVAMRTGRPQVGVVPYQVSGGVRGDQELSVFPLFDDDKGLFGVLEYVRDITGLEHDERIVENLKSRLQFQDQTLQEQETALSVLLRQGHKVEERIAGEVASNIEVLVLPIVALLKARCRDAEAEGLLALLEVRLKEITTQGSSRLSRAFRSLSGREQEIATLVRDGLTSKEIAQRLCISTKAVDFHRTNIRKKLGAPRVGGSLFALLREL